MENKTYKVIGVENLQQDDIKQTLLKFVLAVSESTQMIFDKLCDLNGWSPPSEEGESIEIHPNDDFCEITLKNGEKALLVSQKREDKTLLYVVELNNN